MTHLHHLQQVCLFVCFGDLAWHRQLPIFTVKTIYCIGLYEVLRNISIYLIQVLARALGSRSPEWNYSSFSPISCNGSSSGGRILTYLTPSSQSWDRSPTHRLRTNSEPIKDCEVNYNMLSFIIIIHLNLFSPFFSFYLLSANLISLSFWYDSRTIFIYGHTFLNINPGHTFSNNKSTTKFNNNNIVWSKTIDRHSLI